MEASVVNRRDEIRRALAESPVTPWVYLVVQDWTRPYQVTTDTAAWWFAHSHRNRLRLCTPCDRCGRVLEDLPVGVCECGGGA